MTIKWIMYWQPNPGTTMSNAKILEELSQCAESIHGINQGPWKSTVSYYRPIITAAQAPNPFPAEFMGISLSYEPDKYFMIIREQKLVVEARSNMPGFMEGLQSYRMLMSVDFEGILYGLGDFQVRVGTVSYEHSDRFRTFVVEIEYPPISSWEMSQEIMGEFLDIWKEAVSKKSLQGQFVHNEPNFSEYELTNSYSPQHTAVQYATITAQIMEANARVVQGRHV